MPEYGEDERRGEIATRGLFECDECHYQCSVTAGTRLQDTQAGPVKPVKLVLGRLPDPHHEEGHQQ